MSRRMLAAALALAAVTAAAQSAPKPEAVRLYEQGLSRQIGEDYTAAVDLYRASLRANPGYVLPMLGLAESFDALGEPDEALRWMGEARKGDRRNLELPVLEARIRTTLGQLPEARALLRTVLDEAPNDVGARIALARLERLDGNRREAAVQLERAVAVAPDNPDALLELALTYDALGEPERADPYLRRAVDRYSEDPRIHLAAGRALLERGDLAGARISLQRALDIRPSFAEASLELARVDLTAGDAAGAASETRKALGSADPQIRRAARYLAGVAAERQDQVGEALASYMEALRLAPDDEVARIAAENLALRAPKQSADARRELARYHLREGASLEARNMLPLALLELRRALRLDPEQQQARRAYAEVYRLQGFPLRTLNELILLRDFYGSKDQGVLDDVEAMCSSLSETPASRWIQRLGSLKGCDTIADQYGLARSPVTLSVFSGAPAQREAHFGSSTELGEVVRDLLLRYDQVRVSDAAPQVASEEAAHEAARKEGSDYYVVLTFAEDERSLRARADLHLTRTGERLASVSQMRTGNNRVRDALARLAEQVAGLLPIRGTIVAREADRALIDLGTWDGVAQDARFLIVRRGALGTDNAKVAWAWREQDVVGELVVTAVDEKVAEGTVSPRTFFDRVNSGDFVVPEPKTGAAN